MKLRLCIGVILVLCCGHLSARETFPLIYTMNTGWAFFRGDVKEGYKPTLDVSSWMPASLPHIMQLERKHCGGDVIYDGVGWYRRKFTAPESFQGKRVAVSFEGVMNACTVYLNGDSLYHHRGGYVGFTVDLSKHLKFGAENVLALRVSAEYDPLTPPGKPQDRLDFYYYSGIYRDVTLHVTDRLHISDALEEDLVAGGGIFVTYPEVSAERSVVSVRTHLKNDGPTARAGQYRAYPERCPWACGGAEVAGFFHSGIRTERTPVGNSGRETSFVVPRQSLSVYSGMPGERGKTSH